MSEKHDFTFEYVEPPDGAFGAFVNGSWNGLVRQVIYGEIDIVATAFSVTYPRSKLIDYSFPFSAEPMSILIPYPRLDSTISGIVRPFQYEVWIGIILSILILALILWLISRFESRREAFRGKIGLFDYFWFLFRVLANSNEVIAFTLATRLIVTAWCLTAVVFVNSYTSSLVSYLMAPKFVPVITTLQSLADSKEISLMVLKHTSVETTLFAATTGALAKIGALLQAHPENQLNSLENIEDQVYYQRKAFPHEETSLIVRIHDDLKATKQCRLAIAKEPLYPDTHAFGLAKHSPLTKTFDRELIWLRQLGLLDHWKTAALPPPNRCSAPISRLRSTPNKKLTLDSLSSAFLLYAVGVIASILVFVVELIFFKCF
ncbi:glutamate receptor ionotropic, kainate 2-like [Daphnia carinata]|uniref:glutamate receptor ionotropic, kainate 2-like n=1 Tax=Daphnia carinata TaxID=120202 RepID=UPI002869534F|nr:glutamate receptor ionotropic, kainate 2-like [Daphnia carinata]